MQIELTSLVYELVSLIELTSMFEMSVRNENNSRKY